MSRMRALVVGALACLALAVVLYTYDVHVPITGNGPPHDSFCGSAYDVVFLKKDGYMGGEIPPNQDRIDAACVSRARKVVAGSFGAGGLGLGLLGVAGALRLREQSRTKRQS